MRSAHRAGLAAAIARLEPSEIVVSDALYGDPELAPYLRSLPAVTPLTRDVFDGSTAERRLSGYFAVATTEAFGTMSRLELTAAAACITYVERTQLGQRPPLSPPSREAQDATLLIDQATRANLELVRTLSGERSGSLLAAIDRTVTVAGSRLLAQRLAAPLTDPAAIARRHDAVAHFVADPNVRRDTRERLKAAPDLARALARLVVGRGGPRDLAAIRDGIAAAADLARELQRTPEIPDELAQAATALCRPDPKIASVLAAALDDELPYLKRDGGLVRPGYDPALDELRALRDESRRVIAALQARYADASSVRALKVRHNNVLGYFVEVGAQHGDKLMAPPLNATFIHRQTLAGQVRFTTAELGELEGQRSPAQPTARSASRSRPSSGSPPTSLPPHWQSRTPPRRSRSSTSAARWRNSPPTATYARPVVDDGLDFIIEGWAPSGGRAGAHGRRWFVRRQPV